MARLSLSASYPLQTTITSRVLTYSLSSTYISGSVFDSRFFKNTDVLSGDATGVMSALSVARIKNIVVLSGGATSISPWQLLVYNGEQFVPGNLNTQAFIANNGVSAFTTGTITTVGALTGYSATIFPFQQLSLTSNWHVDHGLNTYLIDVQAYVDNILAIPDIDVVNKNTMNLKFSSPTSGIATLLAIYV